MKKKIGISISDINHKYYSAWFNENIEEIEIVELSFKKNNINAIDSIDGLVLTGGGDIDPAFYGAGADYHNMPKLFKTDRDKFEIDAFQKAQKNHIPVLGICRGLQLINVIYGGTLLQDLGDDILNKVHKKDLTDKIHEVKITKDTLLSNITGLETGQVNSAHHQAIDKLGRELIVNCRSADGTIEGIEWADKMNKPFMLAVQWHPERMEEKEKSPLSENIKERFIREVNMKAAINNENH
jgi:putative glutamine amidotransferase